MDLRPNGRRAVLWIDGSIEGIEIDLLSDDALPRVGDIVAARVETRTGDDAFVAIDRSANQTPASRGNNPVPSSAQGYLVDAASASPGDTLRLQVKRGPEPGKAARLTPRLQIEGRFTVLTPDAPGINISKKITDEARRAHLSALLSPFGTCGGIVVRTRAAAATDAALIADIERLAGRASATVARGPDAHARAALRWEADEIILQADIPRSFDDIPHGMAVSVDPDPFERFDAEQALRDLAATRHPLDGGASLMIERTQAAVAVDINAGATSREAAMTAALRALPRVLRLGGLGGTIVIDPAGKPSRAAKRTLETTLARAAYDDGGALKVLGWGPAGLLEATSPRPAQCLADLLERIEDA